MARSTAVGNHFAIDTRDMKDLTKALRKAAPELVTDMRKDVRKAGVIVAEEAKRKAGEHSKSIPPTIKVRASGATVAVTAGKGVPLAGLYELGNKGGNPASETFKHPIFGEWVTGEGYQKRYPFLALAAEATIVQTEAAIAEAVDKCVHSIAVDYQGRGHL